MEPGPPTAFVLDVIYVGDHFKIHTYKFLTLIFFETSISLYLLLRMFCHEIANSLITYDLQLILANIIDLLDIHFCSSCTHKSLYLAIRHELIQINNQPFRAVGRTESYHLSDQQIIST